MKSLSLKTKMALAVSLLFGLVIVLLAWGNLSYQQRSLKDAIGRQQFALVSSLAENIDDKLRIAHSTLIAAARQAPAADARNADRAQRFLDARITLLSIFDNGLFLVSRDGRLIAESPYLPGRRGSDLSTSEFYRQTMATGKPYISKPYTSSRAPGHPAIFLSAPVFDNRGRLVAIFGGSFDLWGRNFLQELSRTRYSETGYFFLTDRDRTIIVHPDRSRIMTRALPVGANTMYEKALAGFEGSGETDTSSGVRVLSSVRHLRTTDWILAANYPITEAYAPLATTKRFFLLATLVVTVAVLAITWLLMKRLTRPLETVTRHVESMPEEFGKRHSLEIDTGDEIGILAKAFDRMVDTLERQQSALKESEEKFSKAFHLAPTLVAITGLSDGRIVEVNGAFERVFGYHREEIIGRSTLDLDIWNNPEDRVQVLRTLQQGGEVRDREITFRDRTGNILVGLYSATVIDVQGEQYLLSLHNDISDRKRAEEALQESEERYRTLFEGANDAILTIRDGRFVNCNKKALAMFGYSMEEFIGQRPEEFSPPVQTDGTDSTARAREKILQALAGSPQFFEWRHRRSDGTLFDAEISLNRVEYRGNTELLAIIRDVTKRKRAEEALRDSEAEKSLILNSTVDLVVYHNTDMKILWANRKALDSVGMQPEELVGRHCWEIWHHRTKPCGGCPVILARDTGEPQEAEIRSPDGREWYIRGFPVKDGEGRVRSVVEFCHDITERKLMEQEIEVLNTDLSARAAELEAANQELEAFNYTVSHDLRSPLTGITGYCELLLELYGDRLGEQGVSFIREVAGAAENMEDLINTMLDFSNLTRSAMNRTAVDLTAMARVVAAQLKLNEPQRDVTFTIAEGVTADGDAKLLRMVLDNLIGNAWKYTGRQERAVIEFGTVEIEGSPAFFVRDNGPGFDMTNAERLFRPFQRLPGTEKFPGHGIGLATVQRIIRRHGGRVWAEGEAGKGATFYFTL